MKKTIMQELEDAQRDELKSKLIVVGFGSEKKNQDFKDKLVSQYIEAEGYNKNFKFICRRDISEATMLLSEKDKWC